MERLDFYLNNAEQLIEALRRASEDNGDIARVVELYKGSICILLEGTEDEQREQSAELFRR